MVLIVEQFRDARTKEASIEALVKLHRSYSENLGVLVARYYIRFHPRNSCCQRNFKFLRHPTFDEDVDTIDDLLSRSESALFFFVASRFSNKLHSIGLSKDTQDDNKEK